MLSQKSYNIRRRKRYLEDKEYRDRELARVKSYQEAHSEEVAKQRKEYYKKHRKSCMLRTKLWMRKHRAHWSEYVSERNRKKKEEHDKHNSPSV